MADSAITSAKNITSTRKVVEAGDIGKLHIPAENTHFLENKAKQMFSKAEYVGGNLGLVDSAASPNAFKNQINEVLEKYNWDVETFQKTKLKTVDKLSETELSIMKEVRDVVLKPTSDTALQQTIPGQDIEKYISGVYTEIGGYVAKIDDVGHIKNYDDVVESPRLDYSFPDGWRPYPENGDTYGKIVFKSQKIDSIEIPYGERFGGTNIDGPPCTLNGFTGSRNGEIVPEWQFDDRYLPKQGAEIYKVINGNEILVGVFNGKKFVAVN